MAMFTTTTTTVRASDAKRAASMVAEYRTEGGGSNRTDWARAESLLAMVLTVIATGTPVDATDLFTGAGAKPYHVAHRAIGTTLFRQFWQNVQVVAIKNAERDGKSVSGETDTARGTTVLICPTQ